MSPSTPRILYIIGQLEKGGAEQQLYYLLKYLRPDATVISLSPGGYWADPIRDLGYKVVQLERSGHLDVRRLRTLINSIRSEKPDIIHVFTDGVSGIYGRLAAQVCRHPRVIIGERRHPSLDPGWYKWLKRLWLNRQVTVIVANAQTSCDYLVSNHKLPAPQAVFIPNGFEIARFENPVGRLQLPDTWQDHVIVGMVCNLRSKKAPEVFVRVADEIIRQGINARFVHVGNGILRAAMIDLTRQLGIQDYVQFIGQRDDVPQCLSAMDIFVLTSQNEGMSNALMEAMASRLPCVVTDTGDNALLVQHRETGLVVSVDDIDQLAEAVGCLVEDASLRQRMGQKGYERVQAYDVNHMAAQYDRLYRKVMMGYD
jgi:glycosyltransferase involved in cell wall biosynthesis